MDDLNNWNEDQTELKDKTLNIVGQSELAKNESHVEIEKDITQEQTQLDK